MVTLKKPKRVCEECGRDEDMVRRQDEPPAVIKLRWYRQGARRYGIALCDRCHNGG